MTAIPHVQRRLKEVAITVNALADILQWDGARRVRMQGYPAGAIVTAAFLDQQQGVIRLHVTRPDFPEIAEGDLPPGLFVTMQEILD